MSARSVLRVIGWTGAGQLPLAVSLDDAKAHLRVDHDDEDMLIEGYLRTAIEGLDGPKGWLYRGLINQDYALDLSGFEGGDIALPLSGVSAVKLVQYKDGAGVNNTLSSDAYKLVTDSRHIAYLSLRAGQAWPQTLNEAASVTITFTSGFGATAADVPFPVTAAIKLMTGTLYRNREQSSDRASYDNSTYDALLSPYRRRSV